MSCTNLRDKVITEQNKETIYKEIKDSKDFTVEEVGLLQRHLLRSAMLGAFSKDKTSPSDVGKTLSGIIDDERKWDASQKLREEQEKLKEEQEKKVAEQAKLEEDKKRLEMSKALLVTVYDKGFREADSSEGEYQDYITMKFVYKNNSKKTIQGFKGSVEFRDLFGDTIATMGLQDDDPIKAGAKTTADMTVDYNQFKDSSRKLASTDLNKLKIVWLPETILFADGTSLHAQSKE